MTEFCAGGDLAQLIAARKEQRMRGKRDAYLDSSYVVKVFRQLLTALQALHGNAKNRILHRDLKPANVFLTAPAPGGDVKLGDFGLARVLHSDMSMAVSYVGTPFYMSPEQVEMKRYDEVGDCFFLILIISTNEALGRMEPWLSHLRAMRIASAIYREKPERAVLKDQARHFSSHSGPVSGSVAADHSENVATQARNAPQCRSAVAYVTKD